MRTEYLEPIYLATGTVFKNMLQTDVSKGEILVKDEFFAGNKLNISIGVTGGLRGVIVFSFPEEMALDIVAEMAGMKMDKLDKFVTSAVGEMANIISGQAMTNLAESNYICDIVPPQVTIGDNISFTMVTEEVLTMSVLTGLGNFELHLSLKEV